MEIEVSAFGNFSTDTGSTDCNQVNINVFRFRRSRPSVLHGANFFIIIIIIINDWNVPSVLLYVVHYKYNCNRNHNHNREFT